MRQILDRAINAWTVGGAALIGGFWFASAALLGWWTPQTWAAIGQALAIVGGGVLVLSGTLLVWHSRIRSAKWYP